MHLILVFTLALLTAFSGYSGDVAGNCNVYQIDVLVLDSDAPDNENDSLFSNQLTSPVYACIRPVFSLLTQSSALQSPYLKGCLARAPPNATFYV